MILIKTITVHSRAQFIFYDNSETRNQCIGDKKKSLI